MNTYFACGSFIDEKGQVLASASNLIYAERAQVAYDKVLEEGARLAQRGGQRRGESLAFVITAFNFVERDSQEEDC